MSRVRSADSGTVQSDNLNSLHSLLPFDDHRSSTYYRHVAELFSEYSLTDFVIHFCRLAIDSSDDDEVDQDLWDILFMGQVSLGLYEDAYMTLLEAPNRDL